MLEGPKGGNRAQLTELENVETPEDLKKGSDPGKYNRKKVENTDKENQLPKSHQQHKSAKKSQLIPSRVKSQKESTENHQQAKRKTNDKEIQEQASTAKDKQSRIPVRTSKQTQQIDSTTSHKKESTGSSIDDKTKKPSMIPTRKDNSFSRPTASSARKSKTPVKSTHKETTTPVQKSSDPTIKQSKKPSSKIESKIHEQQESIKKEIEILRTKSASKLTEDEIKNIEKLCSDSASLMASSNGLEETLEAVKKFEKEIPKAKNKEKNTAYRKYQQIIKSRQMHIGYLKETQNIRQSIQSDDLKNSPNIIALENITAELIDSVLTKNESMGSLNTSRTRFLTEIGKLRPTETEKPYFDSYKEIATLVDDHQGKILCAKRLQFAFGQLLPKDNKTKNELSYEQRSNNIIQALDLFVNGGEETTSKGKKRTLPALITNKDSNQETHRKKHKTPVKKLSINEQVHQDDAQFKEKATSYKTETPSRDRSAFARYGIYIDGSPLDENSNKHNIDTKDTRHIIQTIDKWTQHKDPVRKSHLASAVTLLKNNLPSIQDNDESSKSTEDLRDEARIGSDPEEHVVLPDEIENSIQEEIIKELKYKIKKPLEKGVVSPSITETKTEETKIKETKEPELTDDEDVSEPDEEVHVTKAIAKEVIDGQIKTYTPLKLKPSNTPAALIAKHEIDTTNTRQMSVDYQNKLKAENGQDAIIFRKYASYIESASRDKIAETIKVKGVETKKEKPSTVENMCEINLDDAQPLFDGVKRIFYKPTVRLKGGETLAVIQDSTIRKPQFNITDGNKNNYFSINKDTGEITLTKEGLNAYHSDNDDLRKSIEDGILLTVTSTDLESDEQNPKNEAQVYVNLDWSQKKPEKESEPYKDAIPHTDIAKTKTYSSSFIRHLKDKQKITSGYISGQPDDKKDDQTRLNLLPIAYETVKEMREESIESIERRISRGEIDENYLSRLTKNKSYIGDFKKAFNSIEKIEEEDSKEVKQRKLSNNKKAYRDLSEAIYKAQPTRIATELANRVANTIMSQARHDQSVLEQEGFSKDQLEKTRAKAKEVFEKFNRELIDDEYLLNQKNEDGSPVYTEDDIIEFQNLSDSIDRIDDELKEIDPSTKEFFKKERIKELNNNRNNFNNALLEIVMNPFRKLTLMLAHSPENRLVNPVAQIIERGLKADEFTVSDKRKCTDGQLLCASVALRASNVARSHLT